MIIDVTDILLSHFFKDVIILYMSSLVFRAILWGDSIYERY